MAPNSGDVRNPAFCGGDWPRRALPRQPASCGFARAPPANLVDGQLPRRL